MAQRGEVLSRRERQIMDVIYRLGEASVADVRQGVPDPPSYSTVRALLRILEEKGHLTHETAGTKYIYRPTISREAARRSALDRVLNTFFDNSTEKAVAALLDLRGDDLSTDELQRIEERIAQAREEGL
ncbi:MAG: BlaI/MecI/CopY family transcriptional regulator [Gemmatimonadetes bacterium]|nr:BlaI/MecI/CopY family transcriptional regulator [Gemmatimonadota bacterium]